MPDKVQVHFLGTSGSMGIPVIGCTCAVCESNSPYNQRMRSSVLLNIEGKNILIDCGPEFRLQALRQKISHLDGLILTHAHHDHTAGIDDLRGLRTNQNVSLPCLLSESTSGEIKKRYHYMFFKENASSIVSNLSLNILSHTRGVVSFVGIDIGYMTYKQGMMDVNGFRFGNFAYISDIREYPHTLFDDLEGVQTLVLSALRLTPSPLHFSVDEAVEFSRKVGAKNTWLTHIAHELDHEKTNAYLPPNVRMAYDGLSL